MENLQELLFKVGEFINEEETLKAMKQARKAPKKQEEKKKKENSWETNPAPPHKKFNNYKFTPLNANIHEVLMDIKGDPKFRRPLKIPRALTNQNSSKYCEFHKANSHYIDGCIALRQLIEKFNRKGKLVRFLREQRREAAPEKSYVREVNYRNKRQLEPYKRKSPDRGGRYTNPWEGQGRREDQERREEYTRRCTPPAWEECRQPAILEIHTIVGGFAGGGELNRVRKAYARQVGGAHKVYVIGRPIKQTRKDPMIIRFLDEDFARVLKPHIDALVVTLTIANHNVHDRCLKVLIWTP